MESQKTKITEIKEEFTVKRKEKNANGERVEVDKKIVRFKDVNFVDGWPRFGHYILDYIFFQVFCVMVGGALGLILGFSGSAGLLDSALFDGSINLMTWLVFYPGYYIVFEGSMQSSPGKLILGRIVVNEYGEKPTFSQIVGRSYARVVPFEAFSCLGKTGWHDDWSNTYVLRKKDLEELKLLINLQEFIK